MELPDRSARTQIRLQPTTQLTAECRKALHAAGRTSGECTWHGHAALIHARLAVVDLENGCQPMMLDQGGEKYILVYNGELYNTPELHAQPAGSGPSLCKPFRY